MTDTVSEGEVTLERLDAMFKAALKWTEPDCADQLVVYEAGVRVFVRIYPKRLGVMMYVMRTLSDRFSEPEKRLFINSLNNTTGMARFGMHTPTDLWCDHTLRYFGGLRQEQLASTLQQFVADYLAVTSADSSGIINPVAAPEPTVRLVCSKCQAPMRVPARVLAGKESVNVRCPGCRAVLTVTPKPAPAPTEGGVVTGMRKLVELRDMGAVTPDEFAAKKAELLKRL